MNNLSELMTIRSLDVSYHGVPVGTLALASEGRIAFQYADAWLEEGFSISPFSLPLERHVFLTDETFPSGVFGVFADSLPDGWGRLLVDRMLRQRGVDPYGVGPLVRLAIVGASGAGALEYRPSLEETSTRQLDDLDAVAADCAAVLAAQDADDLDTLFEMGGSSGGARPKVFYLLDDEEWIVKFPSSLDQPDIGMHEYELARAAVHAGIEMADVRLLPSKTCSGFFATKRFDRIRMADGSVNKVHMVSVAGLLETTHRIPNLSYETLMKLTFKLTGSMSEAERAHRLMVFNVLAGNRDDHSKNFSFLYDEECGWTLSPAYDLTQNAGINGEHQMTVQGKGANISIEDMLAVAREAGISQARASEIIGRVASALEQTQAG